MMHGQANIKGML